MFATKNLDPSPYGMDEIMMKSPVMVKSPMAGSIG